MTIINKDAAMAALQEENTVLAGKSDEAAGAALRASILAQMEAMGALEAVLSNQLQAANDYISSSPSFYATAKSDASLMDQACRTAAATAYAAGVGYSAPSGNLAWKEGLGESYTRAARARYVRTSDEFSAEEREAYLRADADGIGPEDFYTAGSGLNGALYGVFARLPGNLVSDSDARVIAQAYGSMWEGAAASGDASQIERFFELSYVASGETRENEYFDYDCHESGTVVYHAYGRSPLLGRVSAALQEGMAGINVGDQHCQERLAGASLAAAVASGRQAYWVREPHGLDMALLVLPDPSGQAYLCSLTVLPGYLNLDPYEHGADPVVSETVYSVSGDLNEAAGMVGRLKGGAYGCSSIWDPGDQWLATELAAHSPGEAVPGSTRNYDYVVDRDNQYSNYQFRWEWEREHPGAQGGDAL